MYRLKIGLINEEHNSFLCDLEYLEAHILHLARGHTKELVGVPLRRGSGVKLHFPFLNLPIKTSEIAIGEYKISFDSSDELFSNFTSTIKNAPEMRPEYAPTK